MKKAFEVLKDRPKLNVRMTRDSVCAGDDCDAPHEKTVSVHSFIDPAALASHLAPGYLPVVNGRLIATISPTDISPKVAEVTYAEANHVHFVYNPATS